MSLQEHIYNRLPLALQNAAISCYGYYWRHLRFGGGYRTEVGAYRHRCIFRTEEWVAYQTTALKSLLQDVGTYVPYYAARWSRSEKTAAARGVITDLPLLEKGPIREDPLAFVDRRYSRMRKMIFHTSGSTGTPIASIWTVPELRSSMAVREVRSANWAGVSFTHPRATLSGRVLVPATPREPVFHRYNAAERQVYLSPYHISADNARAYVNAMNAHQVRWLTGYAVSSYLLARHIVDQGLHIAPLDAVVTTSEKLEAHMRPVIEQAFGCRVFEEYSTVENVVFASECVAGHLHVSPDIGLVEILRPDGTACDPDEPGEVVVTGIMRKSQPFIRFRLGDYAAWKEGHCSCGSSMPMLKEIMGRVEDVVIGTDGRELVRFHGLFTGQPHVVEAQVVQHSLSHLELRVVGTSDFSSDDIIDLQKRVRDRIGPDCNVSVQQVDILPRTSNGKFKAVISMLDTQNPSLT